MDPQSVFGYPDQWAEFRQRNEMFLARFVNLQTALDITFARTFSSTGPEDRTVFAMGRLCCEEFHEITLLAANGYGHGAMRLLRALYERAVTMAFLSEHPTEIDAFLDYHAVAQHKLVEALKDSSAVLPPDTVELVEREYLKVKDNYLVTDCAKCDTRRVNYTWHKLNIVSMAKKTVFRKLIVPAYYIPMRQTHSTVQALLSRLEELLGGGIGFNPDLQPKEADGALKTAHNILLGVIETQKKFFSLIQMEEPLQTCFKDFIEIWNSNKASDTSALKPKIESL